MAALVEITAYSEKIINLNQIINELNQINYTAEITSAEVIDDWEYSNYQDITTNFNWDVIIDNILENKIFLARLKVNSIFDVGYRINVNKDKFFETSVWLNTKDVKYLDIDKVIDLNREFYDVLTVKSIGILKDKELILAGMGVETSIEYNCDIPSIIRNSSNVVRWILPPDKNLINEEFNFSIVKVENFNIYTLR